MHIDAYVDGSWSDAEMVLAHNNELRGKIDSNTTFCGVGMAIFIDDIARHREGLYINNIKDNGEAEINSFLYGTELLAELGYKKVTVYSDFVTKNILGKNGYYKRYNDFLKKNKDVSFEMIYCNNEYLKKEIKVNKNDQQRNKLERERVKHRSRIKIADNIANVHREKQILEHVKEYQTHPDYRKIA